MGDMDFRTCTGLFQAACRAAGRPEEVSTAVRQIRNLAPLQKVDVPRTGQNRSGTCEGYQVVPSIPGRTTRIQ
jgi:hypothetical protein